MRESLLAPANRGQLVRILTNHVASGSILSDSLEVINRVKTLHDRFLPITRRANEFYVANARVVLADLACSNGVVHLIDRVIVRNHHATTAPDERPKHGAVFTDRWERPPQGAVFDDLQAGASLALTDAYTICPFINRVVYRMRDSSNVTQLAVLLTIYIMLRR